MEKITINCLTHNNMKHNDIMGRLPLESKEDYLKRLLGYFPKHEELIRYLYARFELYVHFSFEGNGIRCEISFWKFITNKHLIGLSCYLDRMKTLVIRTPGLKIWIDIEFKD